MSFQLLDAHDIREGNLEDRELFTFAATLARAQAETLVPNLRERARLTSVLEQYRAKAASARAMSSSLLEAAMECDGHADRISEQLEAL